MNSRAVPPLHFTSVEMTLIFNFQRANFLQQKNHLCDGLSFREITLKQTYRS